MEKTASVTFERTVKDLQRAIRELAREAPLTAEVTLVPQVTVHNLLQTLISSSVQTSTTWKLTATWEAEPLRLGRHADLDPRVLFPDSPPDISGYDFPPVSEPETTEEDASPTQKVELKDQL